MHPERIPEKAITRYSPRRTLATQEKALTLAVTIPTQDASKALASFGIDPSPAKVDSANIINFVLFLNENSDKAMRISDIAVRMAKAQTPDELRKIRSTFMDALEGNLSWKSNIRGTLAHGMLPIEALAGDPFFTDYFLKNLELLHGLASAIEDDIATAGNNRKKSLSNQTQIAGIFGKRVKEAKQAQKKVQGAKGQLSQIQEDLRTITSFSPSEDNLERIEKTIETANMASSQRSEAAIKLAEAQLRAHTASTAFFPAMGATETLTEAEVALYGAYKTVTVAFLSLIHGYQEAIALVIRARSGELDTATRQFLIAVDERRAKSAALTNPEEEENN